MTPTTKYKAGSTGWREGLRMSERKQFEKAISAPPFEYSIDRWPYNDKFAWPGHYVDSRVEVCWEMWKARADLAAQREAELTEQVERLRGALRKIHSYAYDDAHGDDESELLDSIRAFSFQALRGEVEG